MSDQATPAGSQWDPKITTTMSQAGWLRRLEDGLVCLALAALVLLPLAEIVLRATFKIGISGSNAVVQHMTLIIGMLGGAVAARENRLVGAFHRQRVSERPAEVRSGIVQRRGCCNH